MSRRSIDRTQLSAVLLSTLLAVSIVGAVALAPVAADSHTWEQAPDYTGTANFTIFHVSQSDHHPGDHKTSLKYFSAGEDAFRENDAEEGLWIDNIIIRADWIDYSDCSVQNTAAFGIDRGNNNSGTNYDQDLVKHQKQVHFQDNGIIIEFYNHDDLGGDPPYMAPEDAIVSQQGEGSADGPCLQPTDEPGWYRIDGFLNGTVADNGRNNAPSDNAEKSGVRVKSTWFYICDCENRQEAEEKLGPPPSEGGEAGGQSGGNESTPSGDESTPTATESGGGDDGGGDNASTGGDNASTGGGDNASTGGDNASTGNGTGAGTGNDTNQTGGDSFGGNESGGTPTADDGPGFGALAALFALLGSALLLNRRR